MKLTDIFPDEFLEEKTPVRKKVVRGGKVKKKKTCPPGYKLQDGRCVKQKQKERIARTKAAKKANRKGKQQRKRTAKKSLRVRKRRNL